MNINSRTNGHVAQYTRAPQQSQHTRPQYTRPQYTRAPQHSHTLQHPQYTRAPQYSRPQYIHTQEQNVDALQQKKSSSSTEFPIDDTTIQIKKMTFEEFEKIVREKKGIHILSPKSTPEKWEQFIQSSNEVADKLVNDTFREFENDFSSNMERVQQLIQNQGIFSTSSKCFRLILLIKGKLSNKYLPDTIIGGTIIKTDIDNPNREESKLLISALQIDHSYRQQHLGTLLLGYACKMAQNEDLSKVDVYSSEKGTTLYTRFGFMSVNVNRDVWEKMTEKERYKSALVHSYLSLDLNEEETKCIMKKQLEKAFHPY